MAISCGVPSEQTIHLRSMNRANLQSSTDVMTVPQFLRKIGRTAFGGLLPILFPGSLAPAIVPDVPVVPYTARCCNHR